MSIQLRLQEGHLAKVSNSEPELIKKAQAGDGEAFCLLAGSYQRRIYSLARHYCRNDHDAEDLSQEVWLKAFKAIGSFRGEASFYTWLRQIMVNTFLNDRRERTVQVEDERKTIVMEELEAVEQTGQYSALRVDRTESVIHDKILIDRVMEALGDLAPQQRLIFLLKHREGMTYEEIAASLGCSTGTIKKALFRALGRLREHLGIKAETAEYAQFSVGESRGGV